ncbi:MAG: ATP synthase F0 subunit B [Acidobacteriota bacterium]|nr:ATP synthase F0 subunit B [Acidobacteriota bacterium]
MQQVGALFVGAMPTALLFLILVLAYQFLVQKPLTAILKDRRARTEGAVEEAQQAIARAEAKAAEYSGKLREARAQIYKAREERIRKWTAERDAAVEESRKAAGARITAAKAQLQSDAESARQSLQASVAEIAGRIVRAVLPASMEGSH